MKYAAVFGKLSGRGEVVPVQVVEVDPGTTFPEPSPLFDMPEAAVRYGAENLHPFAVSEVKRLTEPTGSGPMEEYRKAMQELAQADPDAVRDQAEKIMRGKMGR